MFKPLATIVIINTAVRIVTTKKCATNTAADEMIVTRIFWIDLFAAFDGHDLP